MAIKTNSFINGKEYYRLRVTAGKDKNGKDIIKNFYGQSKRDAENKRDKWIKENLLGVDHISKKDSLSMAMYEWVWDILRVSGIKESSFERYEGLYRNYVNESHYELKITKPKTKKSIRKVPIPTEFKKDLIELNKIRNLEKLKLGELYKKNNLLFPSATGTYIDSRNLSRSWARALKNIDVPYKKFHSLKHTYATQLLKNGSKLITVSRLLGHSSIKTTEIYAHVLNSTKVKDVENLNTLFK